MSNYPPDPYQPQDYPPGSYHPDPYATSPSALSGRVLPPAIGLIMVAVLNALVCVYFIFSGIFTSTLSDAQFEEQAKAYWTPEMRAQLQQQGSMATVRSASLIICVGGGALGLFLSLLTIIGAVRMMTLKSYVLAVFVSVLAAIPCVSCMGCCGVGEGIGIWSLVVLLNNDVRAAFR
jgi:hypothetical protein